MQARLQESGLFLFLICNLVEDEKWPEAGEEAYLAQDFEVGRRVEGVDPVELESTEVQHLEHIQIHTYIFQLKITPTVYTHARVSPNFIRKVQDNFQKKNVEK